MSCTTFPVVEASTPGDGQLRFDHVLQAAGLDPTNVVMLRHTYQPNGLIPGQVTPERLLAYTREQPHKKKRPLVAASIWVVFLPDDDGGTRARLMTVYQDRGEVATEHTEKHSYFDLHPSQALSAYVTGFGSGSGVLERPYPRKSGHATVNPCCTRSGATRHQVVCARG